MRRRELPAPIPDPTSAERRRRAERDPRVRLGVRTVDEVVAINTEVADATEDLDDEIERLTSG